MMKEICCNDFWENEDSEIKRGIQSQYQRPIKKIAIVHNDRISMSQRVATDLAVVLFEDGTKEIHAVSAVQFDEDDRKGYFKARLEKYGK